MKYDFDQIIDRRNTNSENVEGFRSYMFSDEPDIALPVADDQLIRMWVADMEFAVAPEICQAAVSYTHLLSSAPIRFSAAAGIRSFRLYTV